MGRKMAGGRGEESMEALGWLSCNHEPEGGRSSLFLEMQLCVTYVYSSINKTFDAAMKLR